MSFQFLEGKRNILIPKVTGWFDNIINRKEIIKLSWIRQFFIKKEKQKDPNTNKNKKKNPLDLLSPTKFNLDEFTKSFLNI